MKSKVILIGVGNEFRRDDGAGIVIARMLAERQLPEATVIEHGGEGIDLIDQWKDFPIAVVFDAVSSGQKPGTVFRFEVPGDAIAREVFSCSTHTLSLAEVIELAKTLHQLPPQLIVYGVEGFSFETGSGLSPEVKRGAQKIVEQVTQEFYSKITKG